MTGTSLRNLLLMKLNNWTDSGTLNKVMFYDYLLNIEFVSIYVKKHRKVNTNYLMWYDVLKNSHKIISDKNATHCGICNRYIQCECSEEQHIRPKHRTCAYNNGNIYPQTNFMGEGRLIHLCRAKCMKNYSECYKILRTVIYENPTLRDRIHVYSNLANNEIMMDGYTKINLNGWAIMYDSKFLSQKELLNIMYDIPLL